MTERYWIETLGCPKNQVDSDKLVGTLVVDGFEAADSPEDADLVVVNTCAFIEAARQDPAWREDLRSEGPTGKAHLDLHGLLRAQALDLGLDPARESSVPLCTVCRPDLLYSYRRGETSGRQWGWIEIG